MPNRPQPRFPEPNTQHYWEGTKESELRYQTCDDCKQVVFYPRRHCAACGSSQLSWNVSKGLGTVYTYAIVRQNRLPGFAELGAYAVAYVDLDEGFRMLTNVIGVEDLTRDVKIGQRVAVEFEKQDEGEYPIPVFRPV